MGGGERSLRDTPPFAESAKGRAPRLCECEGEPIQGSFPFGSAQGQDDESWGGVGEELVGVGVVDYEDLHG